MKQLFTLFLLLISLALVSQKRVYDIMLLGKHIGQTIVERTDKGGGTIEYKLESKSAANIFFVKKTSDIVYEIVYKYGKLFSSYYKCVKDDGTEVTTIRWDGGKYLIRKGSDEWVQSEPVEFSAIMMYFFEPHGQAGVFSERMARLINFTKVSANEYEWKGDNGIKNVYRYLNGIMYESEISKGASVFMRLVK